MIKRFIRDLKTVTMLIICYAFITLVEMAIMMYYDYEPINFIVFILIVGNFAPAGFLTDYLI